MSERHVFNIIIFINTWSGGRRGGEIESDISYSLAQIEAEVNKQWAT
jgi:hypothetical protein